MNVTSQLLLIGVGGAGSSIARGICRAFGGALRYVLVDTDATTGQGDGPFVLLGGERLAGRGAGGDAIAAKMAAEESIHAIDSAIENVQIAVIVTALGGGTGGGATIEIVRYLHDRGIPTIVFATTPFAFEGSARILNARNKMTMIEDVANTCFFLPLDSLVKETDEMNAAFQQAIGTVASGVTLFWRLLERPGYLRLDLERLRRILMTAGRGHFAVVSRQGPNRAPDAVDQLSHANLLKAMSAPVHAILCGVLAGDDLRLSEIARISDGVRLLFGERAAFELATVNDEEVFSGRLSIVLMIFESKDSAEAESTEAARNGRPRRRTNVLSQGPQGRGRFMHAEPTFWDKEDLDKPTYTRKNITLDY